MVWCGMVWCGMANAGQAQVVMCVVLLQCYGVMWWTGVGTAGRGPGCGGGPPLPPPGWDPLLLLRPGRQPGLPGLPVSREQ